jgi:hypothetical protein|tara:strand:+ start:208 stop:513 length:306 start_codon:yes stop_codon:yes gene_type:complete
MTEANDHEWVYHQGTKVHHLDAPGGERLVFQDTGGRWDCKFSVEIRRGEYAFISTNPSLYSGAKTLRKYASFLDRLGASKAKSLKKKIGLIVNSSRNGKTT